MLRGYAAIGTLACPLPADHLFPANCATQARQTRTPALHGLAVAGGRRSVSPGAASYVIEAAPPPRGATALLLTELRRHLSPSAPDMDGYQQAAHVKEGTEPYLFG